MLNIIAALNNIKENNNNCYRILCLPFRQFYLKASIILRPGCSIYKLINKNYFTTNLRKARMIEHPCVQETVVEEVMMEMDIPLHKLRHPSLKKLADICNGEMPSESFGRKMVSKFADKKVETIKNKIGDSPYYLIADESTCKKYTDVLVIIGDLNTSDINYVGCCKVVQTADSSSVLIAIDDFIKSLGLEREKFSLFISDAASNMVNCAESLKLLYPKMRHVRCLSHLLHICAEKVRSSFPAVDKLIASVKAATQKNRTRQQLFAENGINLPPQPILTRWGSRLEAAMYYAEFFNYVKKIVLSFEDDRLLVASAKSAVSDGKSRSNWFSSAYTVPSLRR